MVASFTTSPMLYRTLSVSETNVSRANVREDLVADMLQGTVAVASLMKRKAVDIVRPTWILDCIQQTESDRGHPRMLLPLEPRHMFFTKEDSRDTIENNVDEYGDSFAREVDLDELGNIFKAMPKLGRAIDVDDFRDQLGQHDHDFGALPGWMFEGTFLYADFLEVNDENRERLPGERHDEFAPSQIRMKQACNIARFAGARFTEDFEDENLTHLLVCDDRGRAQDIRKAIST